LDVIVGSANLGTVRSKGRRSRSRRGRYVKKGGSSNDGSPQSSV